MGRIVFLLYSQCLHSSSFNILHSLVFLLNLCGRKPTLSWLKQKWNLLIQVIKESAIGLASGQEFRQLSSSLSTFHSHFLCLGQNLWLILPIWWQDGWSISSLYSLTFKIKKKHLPLSLKPCRSIFSQWFWINHCGQVKPSHIEPRVETTATRTQRHLQGWDHK